MPGLGFDSFHFCALLRVWQVRPTSETIVNHMFTQWIHSYRDLPLMVNQVHLYYYITISPFSIGNEYWRGVLKKKADYWRGSMVLLFFLVGERYKMGDADKTVREDSWIFVAGGSYSSCNTWRGRKRGLTYLFLQICSHLLWYFISYYLTSWCCCNAGTTDDLCV